jgi:hypothetical protein
MKSDKGHTARWSAPEILFGECITSRQADIFAFGMVVVEVRALSEDHDAMGRILTLCNVGLPVGVHGERPFLPHHLQRSHLEAHEWRPPTPAL